MGFPERLKWAREGAEMSQRGLAKRAGLSDAHVRRIESGDIENVESKTAKALAGVLGCSLGWLLNGEGEAPTKEALIAAAAESVPREPGDAA